MSQTNTIIVNIQAPKMGRPSKYASEEEKKQAILAQKREWRKKNAKKLNEYKKTKFYPTHKDEVLGYVHAYAKKQKEAKANNDKLHVSTNKKTTK